MLLKSLSDLIQTLLTWPDQVAWLVCVLLTWTVLQAFGLVGLVFSMVADAWTYVRRFVILPSWRNGAILILLGTLVFLGKDSLSEGLQWAEQRWIPKYVTNDTSAYTLSLYEKRLLKQVNPYEFSVIQSRTREMAAKLGSTPLAIYEVAFSECGLNPFKVRDDGDAAGWIQFTRVGIRGLGVTYQQVIDSCERRNVHFIMDLTESYLTDRARGKPMPRACDVYTCVFAPGYLGAHDDQVLYEGYNNPAYYMNDGLDGFYVEDKGGGKQQIYHSKKARDGKLTIRDLHLGLEFKKSRLLSANN